MNDDWFDLLGSLLDAEARFLVVGAHALAVHGVPRATQDLDVWIDPEPANAGRVWRALSSFGAPLAELNITPADFTASDRVVQLGLPPSRIDILTSLTGASDFESAWNDREEHVIRGRNVPVLSRAMLIATKRATGRPKDLADLDALESGG